MKDYSNAFTEAYAILNLLPKVEYDKIPISLINMMEENRNKQYNYMVDDRINLEEQEMLIETKAILFNIFRDYLCTTEQREKIIKMQAEERMKNEEIKREKYYKSKIAEGKIDSKKEIEETVELITVKPRETLWSMIKTMFNSLFKVK